LASREGARDGGADHAEPERRGTLPAMGWFSPETPAAIAAAAERAAEARRLALGHPPDGLLQQVAQVALRADELSATPGSVMEALAPQPAAAATLAPARAVATVPAAPASAAPVAEGAVVPAVPAVAFAGGGDPVGQAG